MSAEVPSTGDVLACIARDGVIVGSVADGAEEVKDVDVVVKAANVESDSGRPPVFERLMTRFPGRCQSEAPGHLWIEASPLAVEVFATTAWRTGDAAKDARRVTYSQAIRRSVVRDVLGVPMRVLLSVAAGKRDGS